MQRRKRTARLRDSSDADFYPIILFAAFQLPAPHPCIRNALRPNICLNLEEDQPWKSTTLFPNKS